MLEQSIFESITYAAVCQGCGVELECCGVQALVGDALRWDVESTCSACGSALAVCGGDLPDELRGRMLGEHGPATLLVGPSAKNAMIMRVLRAELGLNLMNSKAVLHQVLAGEFSGTLPEMEFLARRLRTSGIDAVSARR